MISKCSGQQTKGSYKWTIEELLFRIFSSLLKAGVVASCRVPIIWCFIFFCFVFSSSNMSQIQCRNHQHSIMFWVFFFFKLIYANHFCETQFLVCWSCTFKLGIIKLSKINQSEKHLSQHIIFVPCMRVLAKHC